MTKNLEIYIIELPKCDRYKSKSKELNTWVKFIRKPEEIHMDDVNNNKALKKAKQVLEEISGDEKEKELAEKIEQYENTIKSNQDEIKNKENDASIMKNELNELQEQLKKLDSKNQELLNNINQKDEEVKQIQQNFDTKSMQFYMKLFH